MNQKKNLGMAIMAVGVLILTMNSCVDSVGTSSSSGEEEVCLNFDVPVARTKVAGIVDEETIKSVQVFVFDMQGNIQNMGYVEGSSLSLTCTTGEKHFAAIVNAPECPGVGHLDELQALISDFEDNDPGHFVMTGSCVKPVRASQSVSIEVKRLVSKVVLKDVRKAFKLQQHQDMDFIVESAFIMNAPGSFGYFKDLGCGYWINSSFSDMSEIISASGNLLYGDLADVVVENDAAVDFSNALFCYPNTTSGSEMITYLVVEAMLGSTRCYYPVQLPQMESNVCYNVSLTVTMPGSPSPDIPVRKEEATISVVVSDWSGNVSVNETL